MNERSDISWRTLAGLFLISLATIMDEILLTRIFSVTMWYHFAFGAISLAMFGMTVGALQVYLRPGTYKHTQAKRQMARSCLWFAVTAIGSVLIHMLVPFASQPIFAIFWILFSYCMLSIPFYFSGICICLALSKFPGKASSLYAADLVGAACGCLLVIAALKVTDAPTAVMGVALLASLAGAIFANDGGLRRLSRSAVVMSAVLGGLVIVNSTLVLKQSSPLRVTWAKGKAEPRPLYEKWNSFSRITVDGNPDIATSVISEGISPTYRENQEIRQLRLTIDGGAETTITHFSGAFYDLEYLKYDVKNIVHQLHSNGSVLIVGAGGGRDILSAISMGQQKVRAVEINESILNTVNSRFGKFSGHLDHNPKVTYVNDEARSYIARTDERFDVIEASFIDTWASTAAGALSLTENSLYTVDAWKLFLNRLAPRGVLSFSRWYAPGIPAEAYRLTSLAAAALHSIGVTDPRKHILLVRNMRTNIEGFDRIGAATILVSKQQFSAEDIDRFESISKQMSFDIVLSPRSALDPIFGSLADGENPSTLLTFLQMNVSAPTDDSPFFFDMKPFRYLFRKTRVDESGMFGLQSGEFVILLLLGVTGLTTYFILLPILRTMSKETVRSSAPYWVFFTAIGVGFMLIEVSQMQRLIVFLGHPTYALSVVLFTLLLFGGIGSFTTSRLVKPNRHAAFRLLLLCVGLFVFGLLTPHAVTAFASSTTLLRIVLATGILSPLGFMMGMALPLGLKMSAGRFDALLPAFWGVNGAASICASILAMAIAMNAGISAAFWTGFCCYCIAFLAYCWTAFLHRPTSLPTAV
jgi:predicted membrane-bound spermidine synthase